MDQRTGVSTNLSGCWKETKRRNFLPDLDMINHYTTTKGLGCIEQESFHRIIDIDSYSGCYTDFFDKIAKPTCIGGCYRRRNRGN